MNYVHWYILKDNIFTFTPSFYFSAQITKFTHNKSRGIFSANEYEERITPMYSRRNLPVNISQSAQHIYTCICIRDIRNKQDEWIALNWPGNDWFPRSLPHVIPEIICQKNPYVHRPPTGQQIIPCHRSSPLTPLPEGALSKVNLYDWTQTSSIRTFKYNSQ